MKWLVAILAIFIAVPTFAQEKNGGPVFAVNPWIGGICPPGQWLYGITAPYGAIHCKEIETLDDLTINGTLTVKGDTTLEDLNVSSFTINGNPIGGTCNPNEFVNAISATGVPTCAVGGGGGGVTSFNTRTGAVTLQASDLNALGGPFLPVNNPTFTGMMTGPALTLSAVQAITFGTGNSIVNFATNNLIMGAGVTYNGGWVAQHANPSFFQMQSGQIIFWSSTAGTETVGSIFTPIQIATISRSGLNLPAGETFTIGGNPLPFLSTTGGTVNGNVIVNGWLNLSSSLSVASVTATNSSVFPSIYTSTSSAPLTATMPPGTNNTSIATTAFVTAAVAAGGGGGGGPYLPVNNPTFTGTMTISNGGFIQDANGGNDLALNPTGIVFTRRELMTNEIENVDANVLARWNTSTLRWDIAADRVEGTTVTADQYYDTSNAYPLAILWPGRGWIGFFDVAQMNTATITYINSNNASSLTAIVTDTGIDLRGYPGAPGYPMTPMATTAAAGTNTDQIATTAFVTAAIAAGGGGNFLPVANPTFTGTITGGYYSTNAGTVPWSIYGSGNNLYIGTNSTATANGFQFRLGNTNAFLLTGTGGSFGVPSISFGSTTTSVIRLSGPAAGDDSTQIPTTAWVTAAMRTGIVDGSNAASGQIGEYISADTGVGQVALSTTTATWSTIAQLTLPAGDWDVSGTALLQNITAGVFGFYTAVTTTSSGTPSGNYGRGGLYFNSLASTTSANGWATTSPLRVNVTASTTVYLRAAVYFTGTMSPTAIGSIAARRMR